MKKKSLKIYVWVLWVAVIAFAVGMMALATSHHDLASNPHAIEKIVKLNLPDIAHVESEDNLDRGTSRWDVYVHRGQFCESLSEENIEIMETLCMADSLHWRKNEWEGCYVYNDEGGIDDLYSVSCSIYDDRFVTVYYVDESEGIFVLLPILLVCPILLIVGIVIANRKEGKKRMSFVVALLCLSMGSAYAQGVKVTRYDLPEGELKWSYEKPKDAKMCVPAAFTTKDGKIAGAYRYNGKTYQKEVYKMKVSLKGNIFYISNKWTSDNGFQQLTLVLDSRAMKFKDKSKAIRRALCKDKNGAFLLESNYPMTLSAFAIECSKCSTNATYLDMGEYGYGYIKQNNIVRPLFVLGIATQHKQTNWLYIE